MFEWTAHRFSGGRLALDVVNTVVCRSDAARRADHFAVSENVRTFAQAASAFRKHELNERGIAAPQSAKAERALLQLREAIDAWLRPQVSGKGSGTAPNPMRVRNLFSACAEACEPVARPGKTISLGEATAKSAMIFFDHAVIGKTKICPNCDWLFTDNSKNGSRIWCDMKVCGNRAKVRRHYRRTRHGNAPERQMELS